MRAFVRLSTPRGDCDLGAGDLIGRLPSAALCIDDPRVSEAHALVTLRRGELHLLSLRRMIAVAGKPLSELRLAPGQRIELAEGVALGVEAVVAPQAVLALRGPGFGQRTLPGVASLAAGPPPSLVARFVPGAAAYVWLTGASCRLRQGGAPDRELAPGDRFTVGDHELEVCLLPLGTGAHASTMQGGSVHLPLRLVANYDTVEIHRAGRPTLVLGGLKARLMSELVIYGGPVAWETCARQLWPDGADTLDLRHRWDVALGRLRRQLREAGLRDDLVTADRAGQIQLVLREHDLVEDRT